MVKLRGFLTLACSLGREDCFKCEHLKDCFPKTYKLRMKAVDKRWKKKYGDEF